jgi:acid phosphatase type 7
MVDHAAPYPARTRLLAVASRAFLVAVMVVTCLTVSASIASRAAAAGDPVVAAAGDIACDPTASTFHNGQGSASSCRQLATANLIVGHGFSAVLALGDTQYNCGGYAAFQQSYDLSWGKVKSITHPVVGNHEYLTSGGTDCGTDAAGYFKYFGAAAGLPAMGYYSFDVGAWHLIALNSSCSEVGGCAASSPQGRWLAADLAAHPNICTLAYWHVPLFSSGGRASAGTRPLWQLLYAAHAELVLDGHDHIYERFAPQTPAGVADPVNGIRVITVGTGGANHTSIATVAANSVVRNTSSFGILKLTLHAASYSWNFVPAVGTFKDGGSAACHI